MKVELCTSFIKIDTTHAYAIAGIIIFSKVQIKNKYFSFYI